MNKTKKRDVSIIGKIKAFFKAARFGNIAEGTHSGHITLAAKSDIESSNLLVKLSGGEIETAGETDAILGVCTDCGETGDFLDVALAGCAESTMMCVAASQISAGDVVYSKSGGKVGAGKTPGSTRIGVALNAAPANTVVEVDPQGFGQKGCEIHACGVFAWTGSGTESSVEVPGLEEGDVVVATLAAAASSEKLLKAEISADLKKAAFTLDSAGTAETTLVNWAVIRN
ncbi:MAG: DUF2190 family protein [Opitutales bacterium]|nr:DUF2190 family protein [Opitutales bacterium]